MVNNISNRFVEKINQINWASIESVYYDKASNQIILSLNGRNSVVSIDYTSKKINWIFGSDEIWQGNFKPYLLTVSSNTRYPLGQHTAFLTADGYLGIFNNDVDMYHTVTDTSLNNFKNNACIKAK